jgi:hypothetical protein
MVTVLAWFTMVCSGALIPISVISLLMIIAGSYGTQTSDPVGFFTVIVAPALTFLAGLGLLLRWRWARYYMFVLLAVLIAANVKALASAGKTTTIRTTSSGVVTTSEDVWGGPNYHSAPIIAICVAAIAVLCLPGVRREFRGGLEPEEDPAPAAGPEPVPPPLPGREWRVGHRGRDMMFYEEFRDNAWQSIDIDGEMLTGRAHHVVYFKSTEDWENYPGWARHRREEIVARIKSQFRPPDYEYFGDEPTVQPAAVPPPVPPPPLPSSPPPAATTAKGKPWAIILSVAFLLGFSAWMGWLVKDGLQQGVVRDVLRHHVTRMPPTRAGDPVRFWFLVGIYSIACAGTAGLGVWVAAASLRSSNNPEHGRS